MTADVTIVSPYPSPREPGTSGVAWYTQSLARALADEGVDVTVVAPGARDERAWDERDGRVRVSRCFRRGRGGPRRAVEAAISIGSPVVHVQHEAFLYGGPESVPGMLVGLGRLRRARRGPVVTMHQVVDPATVNGDFTRIHRVRISPPVARLGLAAMQTAVARMASRVIVHEEAFRRTLPGAVRLPLGGNGHARPPGRLADRAAELRGLAGADAESLLVLCFGFVAPYKGFESGLEAARLAGPPVRMVVAGAEHPRLEGQGYLRDLRRRYGDVATFTGFVEDDDVQPWFVAADVVLLPYPKPFSSSGVLAHAASYGVPALVSPALAEVIGLPAEATAPLDPPLLSARLLDLAEHRSELARLAAQTASLHAERSWPDLAKRHLELYEEVIDAQRPARRTALVGPGR